MNRLGIDIGGTSAKLGLVDEQGQVRRRAQVPTRKELEAEELVAQLAAAVERLREGEPAEGLGVAAPGCRKPDGEGVVNVTNLPLIDGFPLRRRLEEVTGLRTVLDNDANAAAMGEARHGAGRGGERVLVVTVGTGIGGGMVVHGAVLRVAWEGLGDPGHVVVAPNGPRCFCGGRGCVEAVASVPAILRRAGELGAPVTLPELATAARDHQPAALQVFAEAGAQLGIALVSLSHLLAPDRVLLGGGGMDAAEDLLLTPLREAFDAHIQPFFAQRLTLGRAALGNDAGVVGAAALL
jgi:glucokinase